MKSKSGREIKEGDKLRGVDHALRPVEGIAIKGDKAKHQRDFIFQHAEHKTVCPSLNLEQFTHVDDETKPAKATA